MFLFNNLGIYNLHCFLFFRDEWNYRWEGFIGKEFGLKIEDEGVRLLRKYGINMNDVRESIKRKEVNFSFQKHSIPPKNVFVISNYCPRVLHIALLNQVI